MELAVDEFIVDWHLSQNDDERQSAEYIVALVKKRCHRIVFDEGYLKVLSKKLEKIGKNRRNDAYVTLHLAKRMRLLLQDSKKIRISTGPDVTELRSVKDENDRLVIKSALCIPAKEKPLITPDQKLVGTEFPIEKYGIKWLSPKEAEKRLAEENQACTLQ